MYRLKEIQDKLLHVVGWEQSIDPSKEINVDLTETESGLYFQGAHALMTLNNIESIMPEEWGLQYPLWLMTKSYFKGDKVRNFNVVYIAKNNNIGSEPNQNSTDWSIYNTLSDYLERETRKAISSTIQNFIQIKQLNEETKNLMQRSTLFDNSGRINNTTTNSGRLVGFEINNARSMGVTSQIEKIGLQMKGGTGGMVRIYLFHSSKVEPIKSIDIEVLNPNGSFQWYKAEDFYLPFISDFTNSGGSWFVCYNQDDLPDGMQAINVSKDWSSEPCGGCNAGDIHKWNEITKFVQISPFMINAQTTFKEFPEMWDISQMIYTNTQNYGLNIEMTVGCDLTDFIISQRSLFQTAIQKQVATTLLRIMAMNPDVRVNRNQSNVSQMQILYELDGDSQGTHPKGLGHELKRAYEALNIDTRGIDKFCLKCKSNGVKYRTV
jgi:hypothetical protein